MYIYIYIHIVIFYFNLCDIVLIIESMPLKENVMTVANTFATTSVSLQVAAAHAPLAARMS